MTHRNQIGSSLRGHDSRQPRHLQRIALRILRQRLEHRGTQYHEGASLSLALARRFCGNIDHSCSSRMIVMRKLLWHPKDILLEAFRVSHRWISGPNKCLEKTD